MSQVDVYVRIENEDGSNVYSVLDETIPDAYAIAVSGGLEIGGTASIDFSGLSSYSMAATGALEIGGAPSIALQSVYTHDVYVRVENASGSNVYNVSTIVPDFSQYSIAVTGGLEIGGSAGMMLLDAYTVLIASLHSVISERLYSVPDIEVGDYIQWDNVVGGARSDVTVNDDATYTADESVTAFDWRIVSGGDTGEWTTQFITGDVLQKSIQAIGGLEISGSASITANLQINSYSIAASGTLEIGGAPSIQYQGVTPGYSIAASGALEIGGAPAMAYTRMDRQYAIAGSGALEIGGSAVIASGVASAFATTAPRGRVLRFH